MNNKDRYTKIMGAIAAMVFMVWWNWDTSLAHSVRDVWEEGDVTALTLGGPCNEGLSTARELLGENELLTTFSTPELKRRMKERGYREGSWIKLDRSTVTVDRKDDLGNVICSVNYTVDMKKYQDELQKLQDPKEIDKQNVSNISNTQADSQSEKLMQMMGLMMANTQQRALYSVKKTTNGDLWITLMNRNILNSGDNDDD